MQVGDVAGLGAARVDDDDAHGRSRALGRLQALEQHGMAPGEVAADQHDQVGELEIFVVAGNGVAAEARLWPATDEAMQSRELVSMLAGPRKPLISLLAT